MKPYLIKFTYDYYCHPYEEDKAIVLVREALSFKDAVGQIIKSLEYENPRNFEDLTI